jgi:CheY-like chemotaxis protein
MTTTSVVLLITESREVADVFGRLLEAFGARYRLYTVGNGAPARAYLERTDAYADWGRCPMPDILLLDLKMPVADGFKELEWIRTRRELKDIPLVVLTESNEIQVGRSYRMGANAFLTKPPTFGELRDVLLALQSEETEEGEVPEIDQAPMVVVKSEFMGLRAAFDQTGFPSQIKALEDIATAKAHLAVQAGNHKRELPLFVDLDLGEGAFELIEWVKRDPRLSASPIVVLCKPGDIEGLSRAADSGAELFLVKPVTATKLSQLGLQEKISDAWEKAKLPGKRPRKKEDPPVAGSETSQGAVEAISLSRPGILYIPGNPTDRHLFSAAMSQGAATFAVEYLESFADIVECVRHKGESRRITSASPGCLLLDDAAVREASGEILRWIRNQSGFPRLLVVMFSDKDDPVTVRSAYRAGVDYYLVKPKSFEGLLSIMNIMERGLRQVPAEFVDFRQLPEYRDRFGHPPTPGALGAQCAE